MAARTSAAVLVGAEDAAAYSNEKETFDLGGTRLSIDMSSCRDAVTGEFAEGHPPPVAVRVDYDATDVARGRDTVLEAAVEALRQGP